MLIPSIFAGHFLADFIFFFPSLTISAYLEPCDCVCRCPCSRCNPVDGSDGNCDDCILKACSRFCEVKDCDWCAEASVDEEKAWAKEIGICRSVGFRNESTEIFLFSFLANFHGRTDGRTHPLIEMHRRVQYQRMGGSIIPSRKNSNVFNPNQNFVFFLLFVIFHRQQLTANLFPE